MGRMVSRSVVDYGDRIGGIMTFKLSNRSKDRMSGIDSRLIAIAELAITLTIIDFGIPKDGGFRTVDRQKELFDRGASKCDGTRRKSRHQSGLAVDFFAYVDGRATWDKEAMATVACAFLQAAAILGLAAQWGGLWRSWQDMPHIELLD